MLVALSHVPLSIVRDGQANGYLMSDLDLPSWIYTSPLNKFWALTNSSPTYNTTPHYDDSNFIDSTLHWAFSPTPHPGGHPLIKRGLSILAWRLPSRIESAHTAVPGSFRFYSPFERADKPLWKPSAHGSDRTYNSHVNDFAQIVHCTADRRLFDRLPVNVLHCHRPATIIVRFGIVLTHPGLTPTQSPPRNEESALGFNDTCDTVYGRLQYLPGALNDVR